MYLMREDFMRYTIFFALVFWFCAGMPTLSYRGGVFWYCRYSNLLEVIGVKESPCPERFIAYRR